METLLILYLVAGGFLILISLTLLVEKIKPNPLYGFRVSQTLNDPKIWYATNKYAARWLIGAGAGIVSPQFIVQIQLMLKEKMRYSIVS